MLVLTCHHCQHIFPSDKSSGTGHSVIDFSFDIRLIILALVIAIASSYTAISLVGRIRFTEPRFASVWLAGGTLALGVSMWSMHFIALLSITTPKQLSYNPTLTVASLIISIAVSGTAVKQLSRSNMSARQLIMSSVVLGFGLGCMHFIGMQAMRTSPVIRMTLLPLVLSTVVATAGIITGLSMARVLRLEDTKGRTAFKLFLSIVVGLSLTASLLLAVLTSHIDVSGVQLRTVGLYIDNAELSVVIGFLVLALLWITLLFTAHDANYQLSNASVLGELRREVSGRAHSDVRLLNSEDQYRALLDAAVDAIILLDPDDIIRYANRAVLGIFGYDQAHLVGADLGILHLKYPHDVALNQTGPRVVTPELGQDRTMVEIVGSRSDGHSIALELSFGQIDLDSTRFTAAFIRDISTRKARDARIVRLTRVHTVLSKINALSIRVRSRQELFDGASRIAVEDGHFLMAMIGTISGNDVVPVSIFGLDKGFVEETVVHGLNHPAGCGLTVEELRNCPGRFWNDIDAVQGNALWRESALSRGYRACITLRLQEGDALAGCISLYSSEKGFFDREELTLLTGLASDISHALDFIARDERLDYLVYYDPLTGLSNARLFVQRLSQMIVKLQVSNQTLTLIYLDISQFKAINDRMGRSLGDVVLKAIADRIVAIAETPTHVARVAGDQFALLLTFDTADHDEVLEDFLKRLWIYLEQPFDIDGKVLQVGFRTGVAIYDEHTQNSVNLIRNAETALKLAKLDSKSIVHYEHEMRHHFSEKLTFEGRLRHAIARNEFVLYYQPKIELETGRICGVEALVRWLDPERGLIPPNEFIPVLEETGLIVELGQWALVQAVKDRQQWADAGLNAPRVAVNVSPIQLYQPDFIDQVLVAVGNQTSDFHGIDLEITESVLMKDIELHIQTLQTLRDLGLSIAVDDFGTGYSSLAYLCRLPISAVKIDRVFVLEMTNNTDMRKVVTTIISLAHSMNVRVIAEGVDTFEQLQLLRTLMCDEIQGFLFSKALPANELAEWLREDRRQPFQFIAPEVRIH